MNCVTFLQWCLPILGHRWSGYRKVRRQVCRRIKKRLTSLEISSWDEYREFLTHNPAEWKQLEACLVVTITRFFRDPMV